MLDWESGLVPMSCCRVVLAGLGLGVLWQTNRRSATAPKSLATLHPSFPYVKPIWAVLPSHPLKVKQGAPPPLAI